MASFQMTLTTEECQYLLDLLQTTLKNKLVEEHRTRAPNYRKLLLQEEALAEGITKKLRQASGVQE
jgi:hypothetical protein